jgi:hypothetical protein
MTLRDVNRIYKRWERFPPLPVLVAGIGKALGLEFDFDKPPAPSPMTEKELDRLLAMTGGKIAGIGSL